MIPVSVGNLVTFMMYFEISILNAGYLMKKVFRI